MLIGYYRARKEILNGEGAAMKTRKMTSMITAVVMLLVMSLPQAVVAQTVDEEPSAGAMAGDLLLARPLLLATTVLGGALYIVTLPFSVAGGNAKAAADTLVGKPAEATFIRCLGCTQPGYKSEAYDVDENGK